MVQIFINTRDKMDNLIKIEQLSRKEILEILELAEKIEKNPERYLRELENKSLATLFFQPSTRTRISSSLAMQKLGGKVVDLYEAKYEIGMGDAESFEDTIKVIGDYVDIICLRHSLEEAPHIAEKITKAKIINCGNGKDQHPTQALLDLYMIWKEFKRLNNLNIAIVGGLKNSRSAHSILIALSTFENNKIKLISPKSLKMPEKYIQIAKNKNIIETEDFEISDEDIVYMCGLPLSDSDDNIRKKYRMSLDKAKELKKHTIILNPLPRIDEIEREVDNLPNAKYFQQSKNGVFVRMAIFIKMLKNQIPS